MESPKLYILWEKELIEARRDREYKIIDIVFLSELFIF